MANPRSDLGDYISQWGQYTPMDWRSIAPQLDQLGIDPVARDGARGWQYTAPQLGDGGGDVGGWALSQDARNNLQGYTLGDTENVSGDQSRRAIYDPGGARIGASEQDGSNSMPWMEPLVMAALGAMAGPAAGGLLGGGAIGGALGGAATGGLLADAFDKDVGKGILMGGIGGGIKGYMQGSPVASSVAGVPAEAQATVDAYAQSPMPDVMQGMPDLGGAQSFGVPSQAFEPFRSLDSQVPWAAETAANFGTQNAQVPSEYRPSVDSQAYNQSAGITGDQAAAAATLPVSVNLANAGGKMSTAGELMGAAPTTGLDPMRKQEIAGYQTDGSMPSSPAVAATGGGLLGGLKNAGAWLTDPANKTLVKSLMGGAGALLSTQGGGSGGAAPKAYGAPAQWKSLPQGMSQGLLAGPQVTKAPGAMGLMGNANSGAWRYLGK